MSILLIIGVIAAIWIYRDAQKFGHGKSAALLWALGAIPFVYIFLPLYLFLGRKPQLRPTRRVEQRTIEAEAVFEDEQAQDCPMCARKVKEEFNSCPYCGYTLKLTCENCGEVLKREWRTCPSCQTKAPEK